MDRIKFIISQTSMTVLTTPFLSYYNERLTEEIGAPNAEKVIQMRFLPDYEIRLISPNEIDDFSDFDSDLGVVLSYIKASVDKKELRDLTSSDKRFRRVERDAFHVLNEATDSKLKMIVKEGKIDVCTAIKEIREEGRQEGAMAERERVALNMLRESGPAISVSFIAKMTGFSEDEVMDLAKENGIDLV